MKRKEVRVWKVNRKEKKRDMPKIVTQKKREMEKKVNAKGEKENNKEKEGDVKEWKDRYI